MQDFAEAGFQYMSTPPRPDSAFLHFLWTAAGSSVELEQLNPAASVLAGKVGADGWSRCRRSGVESESLEGYGCPSQATVSRMHVMEHTEGSRGASECVRSSVYTVSSTMNSMACCGAWLVSTTVISFPSMVMVGTLMPCAPRTEEGRMTTCELPSRPAN
ncbi:hypothetical protein EYF80_008181 [Liparis tanakae]|uniref:Uncharacterized protein n=1 Tax=Liparis tanakae TaxID=230148 RepID=A0A4Z2IUX2_9TELE|nr:hypothetical protein EYF80_008181 [Liparis tanakae]